MNPLPPQRNRANGFTKHSRQGSCTDLNENAAVSGLPSLGKMDFAVKNLLLVYDLKMPWRCIWLSTERGRRLSREIEPSSIVKNDF